MLLGAYATAIPTAEPKTATSTPKQMREKSTAESVSPTEEASPLEDEARIDEEYKRMR